MKKLYALLRSMTSTEKRYFTSNSNQESSYFKFYTWLSDRLSTPLEKADIPKGFTTMKSHLYENVLKAMRNYRSKRYKFFQVKERILNSRFLYEKHLYDQSRDQLYKAKEHAKRYGDTLSQLELNLEGRYLAWFPYSLKEAPKLETFEDESQQLLQYLEEEIKYYNIYDKLYIQLRKSLSGEAIQLKPEDFSEELFEDKNKPKSIRGQRRFLLCKAFYNFLRKEYNAFFEAFQDLNDFWKEYDYLKEELPYKYISDLTNYVQASTHIERFEEVEKLFRDFEEVKTTDKYLKTYITEKVLSIQMLFYINSGNKVAAFSLVLKIRRITKQIKERHFPLIYNTAILYFLEQEFEESMYFCKKIIAIDVAYRVDIPRAAWLIYIVSLYELIIYSDQDVNISFEKELKKARKYFANLEPNNGNFEMSVLECLQVIKNAFPQKKRKCYENLQKILVENNPQKVGIEELKMWVSDKLQQYRGI